MVFKLEFRSAPRVHMLEGWLRTFTADMRHLPGCRARNAVAVAEDGAWSVYVDPSPEDQEDGIEFVMDTAGRAKHWADAQLAIDSCQAASAALVASAKDRSGTLSQRLIAFFDSYIQVQAYYQASSERFMRAASARCADNVKKGGHGRWSSSGSVLTASLQERRAWRALRRVAALEGWSQAQVEDEVRRHAAQFGASLGGATGDTDDLVGSLLAEWDRADPIQVSTSSPRTTGTRPDSLCDALQELGQQRLAIREGFTVAARGSVETLREIAFCGLGEHVPPHEKTVLWKSFMMAELVAASQGAAVDPEVVSRRRQDGALQASGDLRPLARVEADALREVLAGIDNQRRNKPLRGFVGFRGGSDMIRGNAFVLAPGRSLEENVAACEQGLQDGDILVTSMTHPWLVPACTRASAIITDYGGVTCHAVVIANELGIPCIVGTGHATDALRSGDHLVLQMSTGLVEKVEPR